MPSLSHDRSNETAIIAGIAREVIRRLRESDATTTASPCDDKGTGSGKDTGEGEKLITIETLNRLAGEPEIHAAAGAIVTPAAREEASRRGIRIRFAAVNDNPVAAITGQSQDSRIPDELRSQLGRRGIALPEDIELLWTGEPAVEVYRRCSGGQRAVMIGAVADVDRFAKEFAPNVWVLDRQKLNLVAAVNVAARIARCPRSIPPTQTGGGQ